MPIQTKLSKRTYPKGREVTTENIREYPGLENLSEAEAQEAIMTIRVMARMMYDNYMNYKRSSQEIAVTEQE